MEEAHDVPFCTELLMELMKENGGRAPSVSKLMEVTSGLSKAEAKLILEECMPDAKRRRKEALANEKTEEKPTADAKLAAEAKSTLSESEGALPETVPLGQPDPTHDDTQLVSGTYVDEALAAIQLEDEAAGLLNTLVDGSLPRGQSQRPCFDFFARYKPFTKSPEGPLALCSRGKTCSGANLVSVWGVHPKNSQTQPLRSWRRNCQGLRSSSLKLSCA